MTFCELKRWPPACAGAEEQWGAAGAILLLDHPGHRLPLGTLCMSWHWREEEMLNAALQSLRADVFWQLRRLINDSPLDVIIKGSAALLKPSPLPPLRSLQ